MNKIMAIIELMRLNKPIGIYLLLWPALLALVISTNGNFEYSHLLIVITGSILVRSAGCVINDIWDQDLDGDVERTKTRPIPSKKLSISESWAVFVALGVLSLMLLSLTNTNTIFISICFGLMIILYPLTKRFFIGPQIFLGLTFNPTIIVYAMTNELNNPTMIFLYFAIAAKTIAFDSFYGLCDVEDDKKLGIHSTPLWWGSKTLLVIAILQFAVISLFLIVGLKAELSFAWYIGIILLSGFYFYQHQLASQKNFLLAFKNNHWASLYLLILSVFCFLII
ncbi:4-hydroxybenzoate octaprenyltransferase [Gammaproteobacteria bacterium]|jgi:4-hydroxybenzoate polyprenyltransferase|nr:4-hydroxybenzoate octaprenyltransferase [Gammaproteobacteria bacterium]MDC0918404.1 4-hydroxybenzoate octaprenyltransferase [Gammaproteobacteria bacterium]